MWKFIVLLAFVNNLNHVLSDEAPQVPTTVAEPQTLTIAKPSPKTCCNHEIYCCGKKCTERTCENIGKKSDCSSTLKDQPCKDGCCCKPGYYRSKIGQCISEENCKKANQCGKNKVYDACPPSCPPMTCATKDIAFRCKAPLKPGDPKCPAPRCRCADNYYSTDDGECVLKEECPTCKKNEEYSKCPNKVCRAKTCADLGFPLPCLKSTEENKDCGEPCCICKTGFVRNKDGECIPVKDCPSCGRDPNAQSGCGVFCKRCSNYYKEPVCILPCKINSCECRPKYVYDEKKEKCVLPKDCPTEPCGFNKVYYHCPVPSCANQTSCETIGQKINCPLIPADYPCVGVCRCKPGYFENKLGQCISEEECKKANQCGKNKVYDVCPPTCPPMTCATKDIAFKCKEPLKPGDPKCPAPRCRCADNYYSTDEGKCVLKKDCPVC